MILYAQVNGGDDDQNEEEAELHGSLNGVEDKVNLCRV